MSFNNHWTQCSNNHCQVHQQHSYWRCCFYPDLIPNFQGAPRRIAGKPRPLGSAPRDVVNSLSVVIITLSVVISGLHLVISPPTLVAGPPWCPPRCLPISYIWAQCFAVHNLNIEATAFVQVTLGFDYIGIPVPPLRNTPSLLQWPQYTLLMMARTLWMII